MDVGTFLQQRDIAYKRESCIFTGRISFFLLQRMADPDGSLNFLLISKELQRRICRKLEYSSMIKFEETCREVEDSCRNVRTEHRVKKVCISTLLEEFDVNAYDGHCYRLKVNGNTPFKLITEILTLRREGYDLHLSQDLVDKMEMMKLQADLFVVHPFCPTDCEGCGARKIWIMELCNGRGKIADLDAFKNLESIELVKHDLENVDILQLPTPRMTLVCCGLTYEVVKYLLREWKNGQREIDRIILKEINSFSSGTNEANEIIDGLNATAIWTGENVGYSVRRGDNAENPLLLLFRDGVIKLTSDQSEVQQWHNHIV